MVLCLRVCLPMFASLSCCVCKSVRYMFASLCLHVCKSAFLCFRPDRDRGTHSNRARETLTDTNRLTGSWTVYLLELPDLKNSADKYASSTIGNLEISLSFLWCHPRKQHSHRQKETNNQADRRTDRQQKDTKKHRHGHAERQTGIKKDRKTVK